MAKVVQNVNTYIDAAERVGAAARRAAGVVRRTSTVFRPPPR